jgi:hypothetical protein
LQLRLVKNKPLFTSTCALVLALIAAWAAYAWLGHKLIEAVYRSENTGIVGNIMAGRAVTRLAEYYYAADSMLLVATVRFLSGCVIFLLLLAVMKQPLGMVITAVTLLVCSFFIFSIGELFPSTIKLLHLNVFPYFAYMEAFEPDETLAYRERPFRNQKKEVRHSEEALLYGVELPPTMWEWITDEHGFRNSQSRPSTDVVVLGDSFIEWGDNEAETFGKRLEGHLNGLTVTNLGKAGYNPFQYLEVFKRYGKPMKPKYAFFCFYEGNDINEMRSYLQWKRGGGSYSDIYKLASQSMFQRYWFALFQTVRVIRDNLWMTLQFTAKRILNENYIYHPDIVVLRANNKEYKTLFIDRFRDESTEEMLQSEEWRQLRNILNDFKRISAENNIIPFIIYIPTTLHIYIDYMADDSGKNPLAYRDEQLALKSNMENAMLTLVRELRIDLINLVPFYERAAKEGKMVYDVLNSHWSAEGREIAARAAADLLNSRYIVPYKQAK